MLEFLAHEGTAFWLTATIVLLVIEGCTWNMTTIWLAVGAIGALITSQLNPSYTVQTAVFVTVGLLTVILTRPLVRKWKDLDHTATNGDRNLGRVCEVVDTISITKPGRIHLDGVDWTARVNTDVVLKPESLCRIIAIESTVMIVEPFTDGN